MTRVLLALGSNLEPRLKYLNIALNRLKSIGDINRVAPLYRSSPYGIMQQPDFFNSVAILETPFSAPDLLRAVKQIERETGRQHRQRWGPREVDLDIIFYGHQVIHRRDLQIPHGDYQNRRFVLQPLADLIPDFIPPDTNKTVSELLQNCSDKTHIELLKTDWWFDGVEL